MPIELGTVTLPDWHPRAADGTCPIRVFAIGHPDGVVLVDTGPGDDDDLINEWYSPAVTPIVSALDAIGVDERDVTAIVNTHLHFDHCGQNAALPHAAVWVQRAEVAAAAERFYSVPDWTSIPPSRARTIDGDEVIAEGVTILSTPGHTPGHQSVLVDAGGERQLVVGQACYLCSAYERREVESDNLHDESWAAAGTESIERLRSFDPDIAHFSHDPRPFRRRSTSRQGV